MMDQLRPYPPSSEKTPTVTNPMPSLGNGMQFSFTTMEGLVAHFSQWLPPQYVYNLIEAEKEVFVVRREVSLQETRLQFLKKCENTMIRILVDLQAGRTTLDWSFQQPPPAA
ncbi:MAG TPA: hypothetical protein VJ385_14240 [Fibrobacteria bacterium]|nr:hypothetical protein [Fibrobacteria bacterium]